MTSAVRSALLLACFLVAFSPGSAAPAARPPENGSAPAAEWAALFGDAPLPVVWQSVAAAADRIDAALAARSLDGIAAWAETIHLGAHALDDRITLPDPERERRLRAALVQAARLADQVLAAAEKKESDLAADTHRRLKSALALSRLRLPPEIPSAPAQPPRFVTPAKK